MKNSQRAWKPGKPNGETSDRTATAETPYHLQGWRDNNEKMCLLEPVN